MKFDKSYLKSKTLWTALVVALLPLLPDVQAVIKDNPEGVAAGVSALFAILRIFTKKELVVSETPKV